MTAEGFLLPLLAAVAGLCAGSFLNTCIYRVPRGLSVLRPRSHCTHCGGTLGPWELIPLVGYIGQRGRCRRCDAPIGVSQPLLELGAAAMAVVSLLLEGVSLGFFRTFGLACIFLAVAAVDLRHRIIPDAFVCVGLVIALLGAPLAAPFPPWRAWWGLVVGGGTFALVRAAYRRARGREGMGAGDVKLAALLGAALGDEGWLKAILLASLAASAAGVTLVLMGRATWGTAVPFGAFLAGAAIAMLFCPACLSW